MARRAANCTKALEKLLERSQEQKTWPEIVELLDDAPEQEIEALVIRAADHFSAYSGFIEREMPIHWIEKLANGEELPGAQLVNALDLGNGLSLKPGGFDAFFTLESEQLTTLLDSLGSWIESLSYSDDVGDHPLHPGFLVDPSEAKSMLAEGPWSRVHTLRLKGWGFTKYSLTLFKTLEKFPNLKTLDLDRGDNQDELSLAVLRSFLALPVMGQIESLSLRGYYDLGIKHAQLLVDCPAVRRLQHLFLGEVETKVREVLLPLGKIVEMRASNQDDDD